MKTVSVFVCCALILQAAERKRGCLEQLSLLIDCDCHISKLFYWLDRSLRNISEFVPAKGRKVTNFHSIGSASTLRKVQTAQVITSNKDGHKF